MTGEYFNIEDPRDLDGEPELCDVCHKPDARCQCDPTPWCTGCGSMTQKGCDCGPIANKYCWVSPYIIDAKGLPSILLNVEEL